MHVDLNKFFLNSDSFKQAVFHSFQSQIPGMKKHFSTSLFWVFSMNYTAAGILITELFSNILDTPETINRE